jgi:hypothetical protein
MKALLSIDHNEANPKVLTTRLIRFDAASELPADPTNGANVADKRIALTGFPVGARRVQLVWLAAQTWNATAGAGQVAIGAHVAVNALDAVAANSMLTYTDLTGGGSSSSEAEGGRIMVGAANPIQEFSLSEDLTRLDIVGIPAGFTPTNIVPAYLEVRVFA